MKQSRFSNAWYNQANQFAAVKNYDSAVKAFVLAIQNSPYSLLNFIEILDFDLTDDDLKVLRTKSAFNSFEAYAASFTNLSVMMMMYGDYELARLCCLRSIDLLPDDK